MQDHYSHAAEGLALQCIFIAAVRFFFVTAIECEPLSAIANGVITYAADTTPNYELGTEATYSCNDGFFLEVSIGVRVRTCEDDGDGDALGVFNGQAPSCVRKLSPQ